MGEKTGQLAVPQRQLILDVLSRKLTLGQVDAAVTIQLRSSSQIRSHCLWGGRSLPNARTPSDAEILRRAGLEFASAHLIGRRSAVEKATRATAGQIAAMSRSRASIAPRRR